MRLLPLCRCVLLYLRLIRGSVGCRSPPVDRFAIFQNDRLEEIQMAEEKYAKAISLCNEGLRHCESTSPMEYQLLYAKYSAYHGLKNDFEARKYALPVALNPIINGKHY
mgnify:CR=1 FL=1